jgi:hypothetical protein
LVPVAIVVQAHHTDIDYRTNLSLPFDPTYWALLAFHFCSLCIIISFTGTRCDCCNFSGIFVKLMSPCSFQRIDEHQDFSVLALIWCCLVRSSDALRSSCLALSVFCKNFRDFSENFYDQTVISNKHIKTIGKHIYIYIYYSFPPSLFINYHSNNILLTQNSNYFLYSHISRDVTNLTLFSIINPKNIILVLILQPSKHKNT